MVQKPSTSEEEFFKRKEVERLRKLHEEESRRLDAEQRRTAKELHFMKCPKCGLGLEEVEFHGVTLDKCFECGGLWFDEGELERVRAEGANGFLGSLTALFRK